MHKILMKRFKQCKISMSADLELNDATKLFFLKRQKNPILFLKERIKEV